MKKRFRSVTAVLLIIVIMSGIVTFVPMSVEATSSVIENALQWAINIANDDSHLYVYGGSHGNEGQHYDCSSFVSWALVHAGLDVPISTTQHMRKNFEPYGFKWIPWSDIGGTANLKRGDILLNEQYHVEFYLGNNQNVGAHSSKRPAADQINIDGYYYYPWDGVLRYKDEPVIHHWYDDYSPINLGEEFYVQIKNKYTGNVLSMGQKLSESTIDVVGKEQSGSWNQLWRFVRESDGSYVIHNAENDWCLDVEAGNNIDNLDAQPSGTNIQLYASYNGTSNQRFYIYDIFDSYYFRPVGTEKVVDLGINNNLCAIWDYAENFNPQKFDIIKKDLNGNYPVSIGSDFYAYISNQESKQVFSLGNQLSSEVFEVIGSNNNDLESQIWHFVRLDDGSYSIRCLKNNFCLDVDAGNNMHNISNQPNATNIEAYYHYNGTDNQRFYIYRLFDSYYIRPVGANKLVDMGINNGLVAIWDYGENFSPQKFDIVKIDVQNNLPVDIGDNFTAIIKNQYSKKVFTEGLSISSNATDVMGEKLTSNKNQIWRFYRNADGTYTIQNTQSKRYLDVEAGNNIGNLDAQPNGTNVQSYDSYNGTNNQRFYVYNIYDSYYLKPVGTNKMIDMGTNNGLVAIWDFGEDFAPQKFDIIKTNIDKLQVGDTNLDGKITISDVTAVQRHLAELEKFTEEELAVADTNGDGEINIIDATHLQKYLAEFDGIVLGNQAV